MRLALTSLFLLAFLAACYAEAQYQFGFPGQYYFRGSYPQPSYDFEHLSQQRAKPAVEGRFFFTTLTVTLTTSTTTTTITSSTTCTTSTASLKVCTPSGRRRRGVSVDKDARGLYYNDQEDEGEEDSIFLPSPKIVEEPAPAVEEKPVRAVRETAPVPYVVQPGFAAPKEIGSGRFLLAFGTSTTTSTTTTTQISTLTATCKSTTAFQTCGSTGK